MGAAVEWLSQFDMREVHAHIHDIASWTADQMLEIPGIRIFGDPSHPKSSGAVSFLHDSIQSQDLAFLLTRVASPSEQAIIVPSLLWMH